MKKFLSLILTLSIVLSSVLVTPAFASSNSTKSSSKGSSIVSDTNSKSEAHFKIKSKESNHQSSFSESKSIGIGLVAHGKFTARNKFSIQFRNLQSATAYNVVCDNITAYDANGDIVGEVENHDIGNIGIMGSANEKFFFRNAVKVKASISATIGEGGERETLPIEFEDDGNY